MKRVFQKGKPFNEQGICSDEKFGESNETLYAITQAIKEKRGDARAESSVSIQN